MAGQDGDPRKTGGRGGGGTQVRKREKSFVVLFKSKRSKFLAIAIITY